MDVRVVSSQMTKTVLILCLLASRSMQLRRTEEDAWNYLSLRYGTWYKPPTSAIDAYKHHYIRKNNSCKTSKHIGFLYHKNGDTISMPIYDSNGKVAGIQSAIPGTMIGFNRYNQTIPLPPSEVKPPFLYGWTNSHGVPFYTLTAYFKHPRLICNPTVRNVPRGKGLYIQTGHNAEKDYMRVPLKETELNENWKRGMCMASMGRHYFWGFTKNLPCEELYPLFLMYDLDGNLGAFGWSFQGWPKNPSRGEVSWFRLEPKYYPFLFGANNLPACMHHKDFRVSGIHIWLKPHHLMQCALPKVPSKPQRASSATPTSSLSSEITLLVKSKNSSYLGRNKNAIKYNTFDGMTNNSLTSCEYFQCSVIIICLFTTISTFLL